MGVAVPGTIYFPQQPIQCALINNDEAVTLFFSSIHYKMKNLYCLLKHVSTPSQQPLLFAKVEWAQWLLEGSQLYICCFCTMDNMDRNRVITNKLWGMIICVSPVHRDTGTQ